MVFDHLQGGDYSPLAYRKTRGREGPRGFLPTVPSRRHLYYCLQFRNPFHVRERSPDHDFMDSETSRGRSPIPLVRSPLPLSR